MILQSCGRIYKYCTSLSVEKCAVVGAFSSEVRNKLLLLLRLRGGLGMWNPLRNSEEGLHLRDPIPCCKPIQLRGHLNEK